MPKLPASEAAPETQWIRRLRLGWVALATATAVGTTGFPALVVVDRTAAGVGMFFLLVTTIVVGIVYFRLKLRRDEAWADADIAHDRSSARGPRRTQSVGL